MLITFKIDKYDHLYLSKFVKTFNSVVFSTNVVNVIILTQFKLIAN